jgi:hypothetical protein
VTTTTTRRATHVPRRSLGPLDGSMVAEVILPQFLRMAHALSMDVAMFRVVAMTTHGRTASNACRSDPSPRPCLYSRHSGVHAARAPSHLEATMRVTEFSTGKSYTRSKKLYSTALVRSHRDAAWLPDLLDVVRKLRGTFSALPRHPPTAGRHGTDLREL